MAQVYKSIILQVDEKATQAATDAASALTAANNAATTAGYAQADATQALANAATAQTTAEGAVSDAANALSAAQSAASDAAGALSAAESAQTTANSALAAVDSAKEAVGYVVYGDTYNVTGVNAQYLVRGAQHAIIVGSSSGGGVIGPISYSSMVSAGYVVDTANKKSQAIKLINKCDGTLTVSLTSQSGSFQVFNADKGESLVIWYNADGGVWDYCMSVA